MAIYVKLGFSPSTEVTTQIKFKNNSMSKLDKPMSLTLAPSIVLGQDLSKLASDYFQSHSIADFFLKDVQDKVGKKVKLEDLEISLSEDDQIQIKVYTKAP